jgi:hypothetical protein
LQSHKFLSIDLSYNKLTGSFSQIGFRSQRIVLEVNRLSGDFGYIAPPPRNFSRDSVVLNVLNGNIFGCGDLPSADISRHTYSCGSKTIDQAFIWLAVVLVLMILMSLGYAIKRITRYSSLLNLSEIRLSLTAIFPFLHYLFVLHDVSLTGTHPVEVREISQSLQFLSYLEKTVWILLLSCVFFSMPLYILRSGEEDAYSSHINLYRWEWTAAYLTGTLPAGLLLAAWAIVVSIFLYCRGQVSSLSLSTDSRQRLSSFGSDEETGSLFESLESVLYVSVNIAVMGTVNAFYILSTTQERTATEQFLIRLSVAIFNAFWNSICLPLLDRSTRRQSDHRSTSKKVKLLVIAINTIFIPCIVTALTSPSCYQVCALYSLLLSLILLRG